MERDVLAEQRIINIKFLVKLKKNEPKIYELLQTVYSDSAM